MRLSIPVRKFEIDPVPVQQLLPATASARFEGLAYSTSGAVLGAATADTNEALLFRRGLDGKFDNAPFCTLAGLRYPHDLSFANAAGSDILAIAQRQGAISLYQPRAPDQAYDTDSTFDIAGPESKLDHTDAVAFVPHSDSLAACNLLYGTISFYRILGRSPVRVETTPYFELRHPAMYHPDGLAFSTEGHWLATANHGSNNVTIFRRESAVADPVYGPGPIADIRDDDLRYPHSVAFTDNGHLAVTNAGANFMKIYRLAAGRERNDDVSIELVHKLIVGDDATFERVNCQNKMEGGPKGIAIYRDEIAVCSPEFGIKIYRFKELTTIGAILQRLGLPVMS